MLAALCLVAGTPSAGPQLPSPVANQIKASFVYTVAKFVEWPAGSLPDPGAPIVFGVLGEDAFAEALEQTVAGKTVHGRSVSIRRLQSMEGLGSCSVLYLGRSEGDRLPEVIDALRGASVLTVGETERFAHLGGIIRLGLSENMVRFEVNVDVARRAGLAISSKILRLGTVVRGRPRGAGR